MRILRLEDVVGREVYEKAGLQKLSQAEQTAFQEWLDDYVKAIIHSVQEDCRRSPK